MALDANIQSTTRRRLRHLVDDIFTDCRYSVRSLSRQPVLVCAALLCVAIGIAANATMFNVVDTLLLRPPAGVRDPSSLLWIAAERRIAARNFSEYPGVSYPDYTDFARLPELAGIAAYAVSERSIGSGVDVRPVNALTITHTFMPLLGAKPALGRFFNDTDDALDRPGVVVLGYAFWQREFGASPTILGSTVRIGTTPHVVIGVAPQGFNGIERTGVDVYLPIPAGPGSPRDGRSWGAVITTRQFAWLRVIARVSPNIKRERVNAVLQAVYGRVDRREPFLGDTLKLVVASPTATVAMHNPQQAQDASVSIWLAAVAAIVLVIACANVASLLLTRALRRRREISVRLALGMSRLRLIRLLGLEAALLVSVGGLLGIFIAWFAASALRSTLLANVAIDENRINLRVLGVSVAGMVFVTIAAGLAPAFEVGTVDLTTAMKTTSQGDPQRGRIQMALLVGQIALALVLSVGATLFTQSLRHLNALNTGFDVDRVIRIRANPTVIGYTPVRATQFSERLAQRIRTLPGVAGVTLASGGPFAGSLGGRLWISGRMIDGFGIAPEFAAVSSDFFETLGITLRRGRLFTSSDRLGAPLVAVINEEMARQYWPTENPLGKCILVQTGSAPCTTVVGIAATVRQGNAVFQPIQDERPTSRYYLPLAQDTANAAAPMLYVRSTGDATTIVPAIRRAISEIEPALPYPDVTGLSTALAPQFRPWRLGASMFSLFGGIAVALAVIGLYGVLAFRVSQRTHEIGIRLALGGQAADIRNLVMGQGFRLASVGLILGVTLSLAVGRAVNSLLYGVSATDPFVLAAVCIIILLITAVASYLPARRATRVNPLDALREL